MPSGPATIAMAPWESTPSSSPTRPAWCHPVHLPRPDPTRRNAPLATRVCTRTLTETVSATRQPQPTLINHVPHGDPPFMGHQSGSPTCGLACVTPRTVPAETIGCVFANPSARHDV